MPKAPKDPKGTPPNPKIPLYKPSAHREIGRSRRLTPSERQMEIEEQHRELREHYRQDSRGSSGARQDAAYERRLEQRRETKKRDDIRVRKRARKENLSKTAKDIENRYKGGKSEAFRSLKKRKARDFDETRVKASSRRTAMKTFDNVKAKRIAKGLQRAASRAGKIGKGMNVLGAIINLPEMYRVFEKEKRKARGGGEL